jgi:hypothetical protein
LRISAEAHGRQKRQQRAQCTKFSAKSALRRHDGFRQIADKLLQLHSRTNLSAKVRQLF